MPPKTRNAKSPPLNRTSNYKPLRGFYLEIALKYKVKHSKNGNFAFNSKARQSILKRKFPSLDKLL